MKTMTRCSMLALLALFAIACGGAAVAPATVEPMTEPAPVEPESPAQQAEPPSQVCALSDGTVAPEGANARSGDGCNSCGCAGGRWICTQLQCAPVAEPGINHCSLRNGATAALGASALSWDVCNRCTCEDHGWACTRLECAPHAP